MVRRVIFSSSKSVPITDRVAVSRDRASGLACLGLSEGPAQPAEGSAVMPVATTVDQPLEPAPGLVPIGHYCRVARPTSRGVVRVRPVAQTNERSPGKVRRPIGVARAPMIGRRQPFVVYRIGTVRTLLRDAE